MQAAMPVDQRWQRWCRPLVRWRHVLLLAFVVQQTLTYAATTDWVLLTSGARALTDAHPLATYVDTPYLQAGPLGLVVVRIFTLLPRPADVAAAHLLLAVLGWYLLWQAERWRYGSSPSFAAGLTTLAVGLPVLGIWSYLAGGAPHVEDGLVLLTFLWAVRAVREQRSVQAGVLIGLTVAWKPWGVVALPLVAGLSRRRWAVVVSVGLPALTWLPFLIGAPGTLHAVSHGFELQPDSALRVLGLFGSHVPIWWRSVELAGSIIAAAVAVRRRNWLVAFAAGCTARLLLDPGAFDYYVASLVMVTAVTEQLSGRWPWRTGLLALVLVHAQVLLDHAESVPLRAAVLSAVLLSWFRPAARCVALSRRVPVPVPRPRPAEMPSTDEPAVTPPEQAASG